MKKIVILFSGRGTNLENIIQKLHKKSLIVAKAITNNPNAAGIQRAKKYGIEVEVIDHLLFGSRESFDQKLVESIEEVNPDLVVLAGFMRILTPIFTSRIKNAINIHPSLLPLFKGAKAIEQSYHSDMKVAGVTVHWVSEELDSGDIIDQACFHREDESFEAFEAKIHALEYELYPKVIEKLLREKSPQKA
ncbi:MULTISPECIES: phosphoribosylglycinamide formyltransferase [unclassified Nitratiruptor]|uniref:phosphoribosylglycinamide formyltransferase n=1 Tax=unclassified Nitratiruptor TaxID=2624044 RepID=UPI00191688AF|nr:MULTISPECIES: phosphoribosylglycinamide formyltransferase [unclassified Nitratiruptor]BCD59450.1 phosphoribosylglycinamide formyltransferase 1 [Nitratiruptor sp. YY08-10]BCD63374.1 phosphoribosylglycinamide formyltransferase 1 [Nitratiruptor sp. YY08-14]